MDEKTASEKVDEEELVIDVDEPQATIEDLPGVGGWMMKRRRWISGTRVWRIPSPPTGLLSTI